MKKVPKKFANKTIPNYFVNIYCRRLYQVKYAYTIVFKQVRKFVLISTNREYSNKNRKKRFL